MKSGSAFASKCDELAWSNGLNAIPTNPGTVRGTIPKPAKVRPFSRRRIKSATSTTKSTETIRALVCAASLKVLKCDLAIAQSLRTPVRRDARSAHKERPAKPDFGAPVRGKLRVQFGPARRPGTGSSSCASWKSSRPIEDEFKNDGQGEGERSMES